VSLGPFFVADPGAMLHDTLGFYAIAGDQRLPFPLSYHGPLKPDKLLEFYFPLLLLIIAAAGAVALARSGRAANRLAVALAPLGIVGVLYLLGRTDPFHELPLSATLAMMLAAEAGRGGADRGKALAGRLRVVLITGVALIAIAGLDRRGGQALHPPAATAIPGPIGDGVQTAPGDARALRRLIPFVHRLVAPGRPIFVADPRFDVVRVGDPLLYLILDRRNPTRYDVMQPGLVTTATVQRQIIASLERSRTRVIIRWLNPTAEPQPLPAHPAGSELLDHWIDGHYRRAAQYGYYRVLVSRIPR
jgi:hypothetical protein